MNLEKILSIPRSLLWNVRWFGFRGGVKIPILISNHTKLRKISKGYNTDLEVARGLLKTDILFLKRQVVY